MSKAKSKAQSIACANNLKTLQLAAVMYAGDHRGFFPPNREGVVAGYWQGIDGAWVLGNAKRDRDESGIKRGVLFDYTGDTRIYRCPADKSTLQGKPNQPRFRSYSQNAYLNFASLPGSATFDDGAGIRKDMEAASPSGIFGFICVNEGSIDSVAFSFASNATVGQFFWWNTPGERHNKGENIGFLDGHVDYHRWLFTPKKYKVEAAQPAVNDLDRRDVLWMIERTPYWYWENKKDVKFQ